MTRTVPLHATNWALRYAPTPSAEARLVLISISDSPAGDGHHCINLPQIASDCHITEEEVSKHIRWFTARGVIIIRPDNQREKAPGEQVEYICYLNTSVTIGGDE